MRSKFLMLLPLIALPLCSCEIDEVRYKTEEYVLTLDTGTKDSFKILQLTDIHLGVKDILEQHFSFMDLTINDADPDLIVITGDLLTFADGRVAEALFNYLDSHEIYWTCTFGNHDEQGSFSVDWLTGYLNSLNNKRVTDGSSYCIFKDLQDDDITGNANFVINLEGSDNKVWEQLYILDSNRYDFSKFKGYDVIKTDQIDWYEREVLHAYSENGEAVPSLAFYHIPVPEFETAWQNRKKEEKNIKWDGEANEGTSCASRNSGFLEKQLELKRKGFGNTQANIVGHDHVNDYSILYEKDGEEMWLVYGVNSTNRIYYKEGMMGGRVFTIDKSGTFVALEGQNTYKIFHSYSEVEGK